ncbi:MULTISPECIES: NADH-quinone oxidoreductase subunit N [Carboxydocella]|uniref:NADH-quinone oxidoreductase subunit N n=2 Tax=Carboxydocella TaxID=178898 RepID=A0A1T4LLM8_9FIRM|nr:MULTISPECIES: NADH-quinone oxidoreductase subunit N [Carboxydocella]AVX20510.1 NADH dehydrogenase subunit N [Carboxydocella thermautotrophica]AVX30931.1 NADH dehydrogenase subunit N [Carboxydocella thermautotrophica]SJZ55354.1 NADH-quinone oxidoreductase subunit N [Carboxydocella sporoproducens DSM 16521]GAW29672.1 NADH-quinone oxidoreductase subunit N [Carboxydocella sp. ULO1]GAW31436.1 NADH-quinone oxidoreductase subunit N [Carboxydocella sp. JDF658]
MNLDLSLFSLELQTALIALGLMVLAILVPKAQTKGFGYVTGIGLLIVFANSFSLYGTKTSVLNGFYLFDDYGLFFKQLALLTGALIALAAARYSEKLPVYRAEFYSLLVFACLGMMTLVSAGELIALYLGLELMTISFYALAGMKRGDSASAEAGVKYVLLGGMSSAIILYGLSMVYGVTRTTSLQEIVAIAQKQGLEPALLLGLVFLVAGFGFKISAVPFHMWSPDIYQGAPSPVTAYLAVGSKAAAFAAFARILYFALAPYKMSWIGLLAGLSALSMVIGNVVAIPQTNLKRMLAYSGVAQAGYILTGLVAGTTAGIKGMAFYLMIYLFATVGAFTVAMVMSMNVGSTEIKDMSGLSQRSPLLAAVLTTCLLSMAGIPPLAGFAGKLYLFASVVAEGKLWLALVGLVMSMVSVYYYLNVTKAMYLGEAQDNTPIAVPGNMKLILIVSMVITLLLGVYPTPLANLADLAAKALIP